MLIRHYGSTDFITGLRAIAAFMVIAIHTGAFVDFGVIGQNITDNGKYGVQVFFVISGFTVAVTYRAASSYRAYLIRRMFRVVPLYYLATIVVFVLLVAGVIAPNYWMTLYGSSADLYNLVMHLTFLSAWDARVSATIIGPEWTIPIEVFWYMILPFLLPLTLSRKLFFKGFLALLLVSLVARGLAELLLVRHAAHFLPLTYGAYFLMGAACLPLREKLQKKRDISRLCWGGIVLFGLALITDTGLSSAALGLATAMMIAGYRARPDRLQVLTIRPMLFLGSISYSLYIWHFVLIALIRDQVPSWYLGYGLLWFAIISVLSIAVSTVSYLVVERPTNLLGRRLAKEPARN